jgi:hypothetical protein
MIPLLLLAALSAAAPARGQVGPGATTEPSPLRPARPGELVPHEIRPGEVRPDPGMLVPDGRRRPPRTAGEAAQAPPGGGDPGILAPLPGDPATGGDPKR